MKLTRTVTPRFRQRLPNIPNIKEMGAYWDRFNWRLYGKCINSNMKDFEDCEIVAAKEVRSDNKFKKFENWFNKKTG